MVRFVVCSLSGKDLGKMVCEFHPKATEKDPCWCMAWALEKRAASVQPEKSVV